MALITRVIGEFPEAMLSKTTGSTRERYLVQDSRGRLRLPWPEKASSPSSERHVASQRQLLDQVPSHHAAFAEFIAKLLRLEPSRRPSAKRALEHHFFEKRYED